MPHNTPLLYHFKDKHIWFDMGVLLLLFVVASYYPVFKIVPLVACLELFSFFSFHLLARRRRLQLQGFLGGLISSTAVYLQTLNDKKFSNIGSAELFLTLLLALCAMLLECLFILFFLADSLSFEFYLPFLSQLVYFAGIILLINLFCSSTTPSKPQLDYDIDDNLLLDHPIIWWNVAKLSFYILALVALMSFMANDIGFSRDVSTLFVSFFEAHAILASVITEWSLTPQKIDLMKLIFVILLGNTLSKSFLVLKGSNMTKQWQMIALLFGGLAFSLVISWLWYVLAVPA